MGRRAEQEALDRLLAAVRSGESRALVLRGDAGVGKTALLRYVVEHASGCRVARAAGVESEMELAFAGLHQLCAPMLDHRGRLPVPQREALATAFGYSFGPSPDLFFVGLALLGLMSEVARERPLVCLVDDVQWLDRASAQTLAFVARRLSAESVALVFALRGHREERELAGLPEMLVEGLGDAAARALLDSVIRGPLDARVRDRIVAETYGNPLALLELPRGLSAAELAGGFGPAGALGLSGRIEESFLRRLEALPDESRRLLLIAAAEPLGEPVLLWRAAERLGIGSGAVTPATDAGLLEIDTRVRFRHPLVRSAVYGAAPPEETRSAHRVLAEVTDAEADAERRAWHRAQSTAEPDETVAAELERSAGRARARGGVAAAAAFLERAVELTPEPSRRAERALDAAQAKYMAGAPGAALGLLAAAQAGPLDELQRARLDGTAGQIAFAQSQGREVPPLLLRAATRLQPLDAGLARETYLEALSAALFVGHLAGEGSARDVAEAARAAPPAPARAPHAPDMLLDGIALLITDGYAAGAPVLRGALAAFRSADLPIEDGLRWLWLAAHAATFLWDDETWDALSISQLELARNAGALSMLPLALSTRIGVLVHVGDLAAAAALIEELETVTEAMGSRVTPYGALALAAWGGREAEASRLIESIGREVTARGEGMGVTVVNWASAVLWNGRGRYDAALAAAQRGGSHPDELGPTAGALTELVEAAARSGRRDLAADALAQLSEPTRAGGTDWALGVNARSRALLSDGRAAEELYREAIDRLGRTRLRPALARAHLLYGEWLRHEHRRADAREELRTAHELLAEMGIEAFAERARRELLATGERARKPVVATRVELTAHETQIARLAADGLSNPAIGARLFISPRTVEWHLRKVFAKLGIASRTDLRGALADAAYQAQPV